MEREIDPSTVDDMLQEDTLFETDDSTSSSDDERTASSAHAEEYARQVRLRSHFHTSMDCSRHHPCVRHWTPC